MSKCLNVVVIALASLEWTGCSQANLKKYINLGKKVHYFAVLLGDTLHIGQVGLLLSIDPRNIVGVYGKPTTRRLVQHISLLAFQVFLNFC